MLYAVFDIDTGKYGYDVEENYEYQPGEVRLCKNGLPSKRKLLISKPTLGQYQYYGLPVDTVYDDRVERVFPVISYTQDQIDADVAARRKSEAYVELIQSDNLLVRAIEDWADIHAQMLNILVGNQTLTQAQANLLGIPASVTNRINRRKQLRRIWQGLE